MRKPDHWIRTATRILVACTLVVGGAHSTAAAESAAPPAAQDTAACTTLAAHDFSAVSDAPTQITQARVAASSHDSPAYCEVSGYVVPNLGFLLRMPSAQWNGKLIEIGCAGYCGSTEHIQQCAEPLRRGYSCIVSDGGHRSAIRDAKWAYNGVQPIVDYLIVASHVTALAGKAITQAYFREPPKHSYFQGCSSGGQQAMIEAQRFPWDFDGIIAGQPTGETVLDMAFIWGVRAIRDDAGEPVLREADLNVLHAAVLAKCDMNDGIRDGLIGNPMACDFDPGELLCRDDKHADCLSAKQVAAARKLYAGPTTSKGVPVGLPGALKGSEKGWLDMFRGPTQDPRARYNFAAEPFRYFAFQPAPGPKWKPEDFDFDRDYQRLGLTEGLVSSVNPDLRRFEATGGKLIAYAGWSDPGGMPSASVDYYETVERTMGGRAQTQDFFRLFMIPGMNHCTLGDGPFAIDYLSSLEAWVEKHQAPDKLIGSHVEFDGLSFDNPIDQPKLRRRLEFPLDPATIRFSRPIYPYPVAAKYSGHGDPRLASSFQPDDNEDLSPSRQVARQNQ